MTDQPFHCLRRDLHDPVHRTFRSDVHALALLAIAFVAFDVEIRRATGRGCRAQRHRLDRYCRLRRVSTARLGGSPILVARQRCARRPSLGS